MRQIFTATIAMFVFTCLTNTIQAQQLISFWNFNDGFDLRSEDEAGEPIFPAQIVHNASAGSGVIYQQRADIDGNGKGGNSYVNALFEIDGADGQSIAWDDVSKSGPNDAELFITFSTTGFENIEISFDARGNADDGIVSYDVKYDTNPLEDIVFEGNTIKDFAGGNSIDFAEDADLLTSPTDFLRFTIDLSSESLANDQSFFALRLDDIENNDDFRLDNFLVTGTAIAVPEPSSAGLVIIGCAATLLRRRR